MYKKHSVLGYWISEDGFLIKQKGLGERKTFETKTGYQFISYKGTSYYVHRLVYEAFYGAIPDGLQVNHINGVKSDNRVRNLELVTPLENMRHAVKTGLKVGAPSESNSMAKLDDQSYYLIIEDIMNGKSNDVIAEKYGLHSRYISLIRGKKRLNTIWDKYESNNGISTVPLSGDQSKLTLEQRLELISDLPFMTNKKISEKYGIDPSTISRVRVKKIWCNTWSVFNGRCND